MKSNSCTSSCTSYVLITLKVPEQQVFSTNFQSIKKSTPIVKNIHPTHKFILPSVCSAKYPTTNIDICLKGLFKNIPLAVTFCLAKTAVNGLWSTGGYYHGNEHDWLAIDLGPDPYAVKAFMVGHRIDCCAFRNTVLTFLVGNEMPNAGTPVSSLNLDRYMSCAEWPYVGQVCNQPTPSFCKTRKDCSISLFQNGEVSGATCDCLAKGTVVLILNKGNSLSNTHMQFVEIGVYGVPWDKFTDSA